MRPRTIFAGLLIALLVGSAFLLWREYRDRNPRVIRESAQNIAAVQNELARFGRGIDEASYDGSVPPEAFVLLQKEKHESRDLIRAVLNAQAPNASSEQLRNAVVQALTASGVKLSEGQNTGAAQSYGILDVQLERVLGQRNLVAAKVGTSIPCGVDSALYLYEREGTVWSPILAYEAPPYGTIKDAYGALDYAISPSTDSSWYVLVANVSPWCTSAWQKMRYAVMRKGSDPNQPKMLLNVQTNIYEGWEQLWKLRADSETAQIAWPSDFNLDGTILIRAHVARYRISGDAVTRIEPVALYPEDFVDEWADVDWEQAKTWVAPEALEGAEPIHKWLHGSHFTATIEFLQPCPIPDHWQLAVVFEPNETQKPPLSRVYVDVSKDGDTFRLDRIAADRAPGCPGNEYLPQRPQSLP